MLDEARPTADRAKGYAETAAPDGRWSDVDYSTDVDHAWTPIRHLSRCREMALAWADRHSPLCGEQQLESAVKRALDHWAERKYQSALNWWWNEIGVPRAMRDVVVLMGEALEADQRVGAVEVIGQFKVRDVAANLLWSAELKLHHGCLSGRPEQVADAAREIADEIVCGHAEGIQEDWSFFQHGPRLQTFSYGRSYLEVAVDLAWQLSDTPWAFADEKLDVITGYILDGVQWMCRGRHTGPSPLDRTVSRRGWLARAADLRPWLRRWVQICPSRRDEVAGFLDRQEGKGSALVGFRHFYCADLTVHHRPDFSFFLKTMSDRTLATQHIHRENLKGEHLHAGDHYVLRDGEEYASLPPVWDWERLPGVTLADGAPPLQRGPFVGGVGNGQSGMAAMDYERVDEEGTARLAVRKMWAFHEDLAVCLMAGWRLRGQEGEVYTGLDQCTLREAPTVRAAGGPPEQLPEGRHERQDVLWVLHAGIAYVPLAPARVAARVGPATGSWHSISTGASDEPVTEPVFCLSLHHGSQPKPCGFAVAAGASAEDAQRIAENPPWTVLRNDASCQAMKFEDGPRLAVFYEPGAVEDGDSSLRVEAPCLAMWTGQDLWLCDPTHAGRMVQVEWQGKVESVQLPVGGRAASLGRTRASG